MLETSRDGGGELARAQSEHAAWSAYQQQAAHAAWMEQQQQQAAHAAWMEQQQRSAHEAHLAEELAARTAYEAERRRASLAMRFGPEIAEAILMRRLWAGATAEMLVEAIGHPADIDEKVLKTKIKHVYKYYPRGARRFGLKVMLENGVVVGWDEKL